MTKRDSSHWPGNPSSSSRIQLLEELLLTSDLHVRSDFLNRRRVKMPAGP